jgi:Mlc titration factor MtfA (ptsG expression regulator)
VFLRRRRHRPLPPGVAEYPSAWRQLLAERVPTWGALDDAQRDGLEGLSATLLATKRWEAARGFALTEEMQVTIAGQASLLVLGLGDDWYRLVSAIVVHPTAVTVRGERRGPVTGTSRNDPLDIVGQATAERGPMLIAWDAVLATSAHPERGENVVLHEFAHKLDLLDGYADGMPPLANRVRQAHWAEVLDGQLDALRSGAPDPVLRPYAATDAAELFAVATEAFFCVPVALATEKPELYGLLLDFYRQDPAATSAEALPRDRPTG